MDRRIVFVYGMGEKPAVEAERARTWEPLRGFRWRPIDCRVVAYEKHVEHGRYLRETGRQWRALRP